MKENKVDFEILWKFKISMWLEWLTNLNVKGAKRSVKMRGTNFYRSFFKNMMFFMNGRRKKNRSVHTYGVSWIPFIATFCRYLTSLCYFWHLLNFQKHSISTQFSFKKSAKSINVSSYFYKTYFKNILLQMMVRGQKFVQYGVN